MSATLTAVDVGELIRKTYDRSQVTTLRRTQLCLAFAEAHPRRWSGSPSELVDELAAVARRVGLPVGVAPLARAASLLDRDLRRHGWAVVERRTKTARVVTASPRR